MPPEIAKTALLDEWVIVTRWHTNKNGVKIANTKYPIPEKIIERMAYDYLLKEMKNYDKGYRFELTDCITKQVFKVTVERVIKWCGCGDELQTDEDKQTGKCDICRSLE